MLDKLKTNRAPYSPEQLNARLRFWVGITLAGTLVLTGANDFTGSLTLSVGTLVIGDGASGTLAKDRGVDRVIQGWIHADPVEGVGEDLPAQPLGTAVEGVHTGHGRPPCRGRLGSRDT